MQDMREAKEGIYTKDTLQSLITVVGATLNYLYDVAFNTIDNPIRVIYATAPISR